MKKKKIQKIELAPTVTIDQYDDIAEHFFKKVFDMDYSQILVTDESSLTDFLDIILIARNRELEKKKILNKIKKIYKIDASDIKDLSLVKIFERIRILE